MEENPKPADVQPPESSDEVQEKKPDVVTMTSEASGGDAIATVVSSTGLDEEYEEPEEEEEEESKEKAKIEKSEENEKGEFFN